MPIVKGKTPSPVHHLRRRRGLLREQLHLQFPSAIPPRRRRKKKQEVLLPPAAEEKEKTEEY